MMKKIIFILAISFTSLISWGQQELMISQYMFNGLVLNPAYAGTHPYWSSTILHRSQWVKFDKAPRTQTACIDGNILDGKLGLGFNLSNDRLGLTNSFDFGVNVAKKVMIGPGFLSAGLRIGASRYTANLTDAVIWDENDPVYANNLKGKIVPRLGAGIYYYTANWFAGASIPSILAVDESVSNFSTGLNSFYRQHLYLNGGLVIQAAPSVAIKPSVLVKYQGNAPLQVDLNCNVLFLQKFWAGAGYRTGDALIAMLEWNINKQLRVGYAFDYTLSSIQTYANNSHEVMLGYDFGKGTDLKVRSPRYF